MAETEVKPANQRGVFLVTILMFSAFGPYIIKGVRTEQIAIYAAALLMLLRSLYSIRCSRAIYPIVCLWGVYLGVGLLGALVPPVNESMYARSSIVAGLDNLVLPIAVLVIVLALQTLGAEPLQLLRRIALLTVSLMCLNTLAAIAQYRGVSWSQWWDGGNSVASTAKNAAQLGRFSGLINQPAEAGILYGAALMCALYLWRRKPQRLLLAIAFLMVGGIMTVSKIFLLIALPLAVLQIMLSRERRNFYVLAVVGLITGLLVVIESGLAPALSGLTQLQQVLPGSDGQSAIATFTAGRYGSTSSLQSVVDAVTSGPVVFGFGLGGLQVPYDSGFVEALVMSGVLGVACYSLVLAAVYRQWRRAIVGPERTLLGFLLILLTLASFGVPALTANRVSSVIWLLLASLLLAVERCGSGTDHGPSAWGTCDVVVGR
jgi:hypothetical protein